MGFCANKYCSTDIKELYPTSNCCYGITELVLFLFYLTKDPLVHIENLAVNIQACHKFSKQDPKHL